MLQIPVIQVSRVIEEKIARIFVLSETLKHLPVPPEIAARVFHTQYLKSSLFSARIEGNTLTLEDLTPADWDNPSVGKKRELANILHALRLLSRWSDHLSLIHIQEIHGMVLKDLSADAGKLRREQTAIFDAFGNAVYLTPDRATMEAMLEAFFSAWNNLTDSTHALLHFAPLHLFFEKIHPFIDGNGRVGRIVLHLLLSRFQITSQKVVLPLDQYFEAHKDDYYFFLEQGNATVAEFETYILDGIIWSFEQVLDDIRRTALEKPSTIPMTLSPRRQEILSLVRDHPYCSLDFLARRFSTIPRRTLGFDVNALIKQGLLVKQGTTRGVTYSAA